MEYRRKIRTSLFAIFADLLAVGIKSGVAALTGSLALAADALHSLTDLLVSLAVLGSLVARNWYEKRQPGCSISKSNPTDDGQPATCKLPASGVQSGVWLEALVAGAVSFVIFGVSIEILSSVNTGGDEPIRNLGIGFIGVTLTIVIAYYMSRFKLLVGRQTGSPALEADGHHSTIDVLSSLGVLLALFGQMVGLHLDPVVAVVIAVLVAITGIEIFASAIVSFRRGTHLEQLSAWDTMERSLKNLRHRFPLGRTPAAVKYGLPLLAILLYLGTGITRVQHDEVGVRYRFGKIVEEPLGPGLHFALPVPFERVAVLDSGALRRVEVGMRTEGAEQPNAELYWDSAAMTDSDTQLADESQILTGDQNIVSLRVVLAYRPDANLRARLHVEDPDKLMTALGESVVGEVAANYESDGLLTTDKLNFLRDVRTRLADILAGHAFGYELVDVSLRQIAPPRPIVRAYREVFAAREDQTKLMREAETYRFAALSSARAEALQKELAAEAERLERSLRAEGDGAHFERLAAQYRNAPEVTAYRMFLESAEAVLAGVPKVIGRSTVNKGEYRFWMFEPEPEKKSRRSRR